VSIVEADLDANFPVWLVVVRDAPLPQGTLRVAVAPLQAHVPHAGVIHHAAAVPLAADRGPHTPVLGIRLPISRDP